MVAEVITASEQQSPNSDTKQESCNKTTNEIILEAELSQAREELQDIQEKGSYTQNHYTVSGVSVEVLRMETGLSTKEIFLITCSTSCFKIRRFYCLLFWLESRVQ